jgi:transcriptional regulator with XRE-family HTH domain
MTNLRTQLRLKHTAKTLVDAVAASGLTKSEVARRMKVASGTMSQWCGARVGVSAARAARLGEILDIDPAAITSPPLKKSNGQSPGPAERAMALHEATNGAPLAATRLVPRPTPVMGMEALSDGTASVWLKATLPHDRAAMLFRLLLDFQLMEPPG